LKVCIYDDGFIPGLGKGPFLQPIEISEDKYKTYKMMGLKIINASKYVSIAETGVVNRMPISTKPTKEKEIKALEKEIKETETIEEVIKEEPVVEEVIKEEPVVEETIEEIEKVEEVEEISVEEIESYSKKELVEFLKLNEVEFNNKATKKELVEIAKSLI